MSHIHGVKAVAGRIKPATGAGTAMGGMNLGSMMGEGMGSMMKAPGMASGVVASAGSGATISAVKKILSHPLVLFGLGAIAGSYIYKYRKSIISVSNEAQ